jgi:hypothetical protein
MQSGELCEVVENAGDGLWISVRLIHPDDSSKDEIELRHAQDIVEIVASAGTDTPVCNVPED